MFAVLIDGPFHLTQLSVSNKMETVKMYKPSNRSGEFSPFGRAHADPEHACSELVYRLIYKTEQNTLIYQLTD